MIFAIELLLETFLCYKVWIEKDRTRLFLWFMTAMIMLLPYFKLMPGIPAVNWIFPVICLLRIIKEKSLKENWKNFPLKYIYGVILAFHFLQPLFVSWRGMGSTYFYVIQYVMTTYLYVFLGFCIAPDYKKLMEHKKWIYLLLLILFAIAVISRAMTYNFISNTLSEESIWTSDRAQSERGFRVTATQSSPNIFGFVCVFFAILILNYKDRITTKCGMFLLILINLVLCGTRAPMVGLMASIAIFALFVNKGKLVRTTLIAILGLLFIVNIVGVDSSVSQYINGVVDIFTTGGQNTGGSSTDLRDRQLAVATAFGMENPIWGMGQGFCSAMQDETSNLYVFYDKDLAGAESYIFYMFIDYGFVYTGLIAIYFIVLFYNYFHNYQKNKRILMLAVPMTIALMTHLLTSRPDNSWQIFMPLMGACLYMIKKKENKLPANLIYE